jgi:hypothetical protein
LATNSNRSKSRIFKPRNGPIIGEVSFAAFLYLFSAVFYGRRSD